MDPWAYGLQLLGQKKTLPNLNFSYGICSCPNPAHSITQIKLVVVENPTPPNIKQTEDKNDNDDDGDKIDNDDDRV